MPEGKEKFECFTNNKYYLTKNKTIHFLGENARRLQRHSQLVLEVQREVVRSSRFRDHDELRTFPKSSQAISG
jgi:hypothetical protein